MTNEERRQALQTLANLEHHIQLLDIAMSPEGRAMRADLIVRADTLRRSILS